MHVTFCLLLTIAQASASPSPSPAPSATPTYSLSGVFSFYALHTNDVNATGALDTPEGADYASRADLSSAMLTVAKNTGWWRFGITAGTYAFPVVGESVNPTTQAGANTSLYHYFPSAYVAFVPNDQLTISLGQLATLLGQEDGFTYQNVNIQRGLVWAAEPVFSRGVRVAYTVGKLSSDLEYNDGYYSGNHRAVEGLAGWAPNSNTDFQLAFISPQADTPGNITSSIANKTEFDVMLTQQLGKLQILPYVLFIRSPGSTDLGYARSESATGDVLLANYAFNSVYSLGARYEWFVDHSGLTDTSPNADFVGYGPGSRAASVTVTPEYKQGFFFARAEFSAVNVLNATPGLAFGAGGSSRTQTRTLAEVGVQF